MSVQCRYTSADLEAMPYVEGLRYEIIVEVFRHDGRSLELAVTLAGDDALTSPLLPGFACPLHRLW